MVSALVKFHLGEGVDVRGRKRVEILSWPNDKLESVHDYIQWLFPLSVRSHFNQDAPVLMPDDIDKFQSDLRLQQSLLACLNRMLLFLGLECHEYPDYPEIVASDRFAERRHVWLTTDNHNYLRITRILRSLQILGLQRYTESLFEELELLYRRNRGIIGDQTYAYWCDVVGRRTH